MIAVADFPYFAASVCLLCLIALPVMLHLRGQQQVGRDIDEDRN